MAGVVSAALEQRCERPGLWWIEGYKVEKKSAYLGPRDLRWYVHKPTESGGLKLVTLCRSLAQARDHIRQEINP